MVDHHKKKKFLNLPRYAGGNESYRKFIAQNLRYPQAALEARIEGKVMVEYDIDDNGIVHNPRVLNGIGHGCDEEAMRVISLLRYEKVKNRGVRVKLTTKTTVNFKLPAAAIQYTVTNTRKPVVKDAPSSPSKDGPVIYEYTINL